MNFYEQIFSKDVNFHNADQISDCFRALVHNTHRCTAVAMYHHLTHYIYPLLYLHILFFHLTAYPKSKDKVPNARLESQGCKVVNRTNINVLLGDITEHGAEVIVNSVDHQLQAYGR